MIPKISSGMIQDCLKYVTTIWFGEHEFPADSLDEYDDYIEDMRRYATKNNNLSYLKIGLEYILSGGVEESLYEQLAGECWDFDKDELIELMSYVYSVIWCKKENPEFIKTPKVDLIVESAVSSVLAEWDLKKDELNPEFDETKVEYI